MLRTLFILLTVSLIGSVNSFGQTATSATPLSKKKNLTTGFYGKRFVLQLGAGVHHNTLLKLVSYPERRLKTYNYYRKYRDQINGDQFNYSFYGNLGVVLKERTALSVDFQYYTGNIFLERTNEKVAYDQYYGYYNYSGGYDARVKYTTLRIMPRIEIASRGSNMPTGLVNVLGVGVELSKLKSGNYKAITSYEHYQNTGSNPDSVSITNQRLKFDDEFAFNLTLMYGLEYRLAISKNIAWNFGAYAHVNFPVQLALDEFFGSIDLNPYGGVSNDEYRLQLAKYRFQNLFSLRTGIVIML